jgi:hypothetical protein
MDVIHARRLGKTSARIRASRRGSRIDRVTMVETSWNELL